MAGISKKASIFPVGFRFDPNDLGLVRRYLRNKVDHKVDGFLTTLDVYADVPWRLEPVDNPLFKKKEWYYFVERIRRGGKTPKRTVPARGDSEGGTWKSTGAKTAIVDGNKKVWGYKQSLVFNKKVKGKPVKTDWLMTEYSLNKDVHDNTVLCWIRDKTEKKGKPGYVDQVPQVANNIVPYQVQEHEVALTVSASGPEMMTLEGEHSQVTQHHGVDLGFQGLENWLMLDMNVDDYFNIDGVLNTEGGTTQEHGQEEEAQEQPQQLTPLP
ncbi:unnamed protein product [Microthlaspi erraticum]|uniref:NAC domain-containing protein n=1 Tax=Microthlaspi erraticum TaxID=1685480 RepID=A0A6D2IP57_9BRAS|nr:unnamed protein product [Microthlaspi erraticum]